MASFGIVGAVKILAVAISDFRGFGRHFAL